MCETEMSVSGLAVPKTRSKGVVQMPVPNAVLSERLHLGSDCLFRVHYDFLMVLKPAELSHQGSRNLWGLDDA